MIRGRSDINVFPQESRQGSYPDGFSLSRMLLNLHDAAGAGVRDEVGVSGEIPFLHLRLKAFPVRLAAREFFVADQQIHLAVVEVQLDQVAVFDERDRAAFGRLR
jgi:hypothetical protein